MPYQINELKAGLTVAVDNDIFMIVNVEHVKPGKGSAIARVKLRNLRLGTVIDRTYRTSDTIQDAFVEEKELQFSYQDGSLFHFLDQETFEDHIIDEDRLESIKGFLKDNIIIAAYFHNNEILTISLPKSMTYKVIQTEPGIKGDTAKGANKPAIIEGGATIQVPLFINEGDRIKIDTRTGEYLERG